MLILLALPAQAREVRDQMGVFTHVTTSEHFAVKWGDVAPNPDDVDALLVALETAWSTEVDDLDYPAPFGADDYYVNVYVGNSGGAAPSIDFIGGLAKNDLEGFGYIVIHPTILTLFSDKHPKDFDVAAPIPYAQEICAHEFFHVLQLRTAAFALPFQPWVWESGADWAAQLVAPEGGGSWTDAAAYWTSPNLPISAEAEPTEEDPNIGMRIYGAWTWWGYLDEVMGDRSVLHDVWTLGQVDDDALAFTAAQVEAHGYDFPSLFLDFAAHNAAYDYSFAGVPAQAIRLDGASYGQGRIVATWNAEGTGGWQDANPTFALHRASYNVIELWHPGTSTWDVEVDAEDPGIQATVAITGSDGVRYEALDGQPVATLDTDESMFLVVAATSLEGDDTTTLPYRYQIVPSEEPTKDPTSSGTPASCGCAQTARPPGAVVAFVWTLGLMISRRRRCG